MKSYVQTETTIDGVLTDITLSSQYDNAFPFPRGDSFGVCSNFKSAYFMLDD